MVVFRPFKGEVMLAKISSSSSDGIKCASDIIYLPPFFHFKKLTSLLSISLLLIQRKVRLDFFNDIFIPGDLLFPGSELCVFYLSNPTHLASLCFSCLSIKTPPPPFPLFAKSTSLMLK